MHEKSVAPRAAHTLSSTRKNPHGRARGGEQKRMGQLIRGCQYIGSRGEVTPGCTATALVMFHAVRGGRRWLIPVVTELWIDWWDALQGGEIQQREVAIPPAGSVDVIHVPEYGRLTQRRVAHDHCPNTLHA